MSEYLLILVPFTTHLEAIEYPDSRIVVADCTHRAWLSPQSDAHIAANPGVRTTCLPCLTIAAAGRPVSAYLVPGSLDRARALGQDMDAIAAWTERTGLTELPPDTLPPTTAPDH